jgi:hypothetical protein
MMGVRPEGRLRRGADMSLLVIVGMLVVQVALFWGYMVLVERSGTTVVRGILGAILVATLLAMGLAVVGLAIPAPIGAD